MKDKPGYYSVNAALTAVVMYYVLDLSKAGRTAIDWTVIGLVAGAMLWNLVQLGRRLRKSVGGRALWHLQRTLLFWVVGLFNTALIQPQHVGAWRHWVGWTMLLIALCDSVALYVKERRIVTAADIGEVTA